MPTCGWILETATDRWSENVANRFSFAAKPSPRPVFTCPYCGTKFRSEDERHKHLGLDHPLDLPMIEVAGTSVATRTVFRCALRSVDVCVHLATRGRIKKLGGAWEPLDIKQMGRHLADQKDGCWIVELTNERAVDKATTCSRYEISFRVPSETEMDNADAAFVDVLAVDGLTHQNVMKYSKYIPSKAAPREYAAALGDYAIAILLKEQRRPPRAPVGFQEFAAKMRASLDVLRYFRRPVALAVCSSIRFNLNEFKHHDWLPQCDAEIGEAFFLSVFR